MRRRQFITLLGGMAAAWPVLAQSQSMLRIGIVAATPRNSPFWIAFDKRMRELGYDEGQNLAVEFLNVGSAAGYPERMKELIQRRPDIIVAPGAEVVLKSAVAAATALPIVMIAIDYDPFAQGYVTSLSHPTGNVTGVFFQQIELSAKRMELAKELVAGLQSVAVLWDGASADQFQSLKSAGQHLGIKLFGLEMRDRPYNYVAAWDRVPLEYRSMLVLPTSPTFFVDRQEIANFTIERHIPTMFSFREWVDAGGLASYGASITGLFRRAAEYVDKLAKGATPSDLPIEQPTKFELVLNLKTAKAIGLTIPEPSLLRADEVIE